MRRERWLARLGIVSIFAGACAPFACGGSGGTGSISPGSDGGGPSSDGSPSGNDGSVNGDASGTDGNTTEGGSTTDGATCTALLQACNQASDCCSHLCLGNQCVSSPAVCGNPGDKCGVSTDCCNGSCVNGTCGATQCLSIGATCPVPGNTCCTDTCVGGKCAPIGSTLDGGTVTPVCTTAGNTCAKAADCCSGLCTNGTCNLASSYCVQTNDICFTGADCCTATCASPNSSPVSATNPGTCVMPATGGVNCTGVDGTLCDPSQIGCAAGCCSDLCEPYGPTGVAICTQAQGCHVEGDLCRKDTDCCGGEPVDAGILGGGLVTCVIPDGGAVGICSTPTPGAGGHNACVPAGDVCQYNNSNSDGGYACSSSSTRSNCCDGQTPDKYLCQLDKLGIPRCLAYGGGGSGDGGTDGGPNACRQTAQTCSTAGDCCDGVPCVPDPTGQLVCASTSCIPSTGACTSNADCCAGNTCVVPVGALGGTCSAPPPPPPPPPTDGGTTSDAGTADASASCAYYGQSCASLPCCANTYCVSGSCQNPAR
jgi:hypothetical protein